MILIIKLIISGGLGDITIMITGVTGMGKTSTCNFLFGEDKFEADDGLSASTTKSDTHDTVLNGRKVQIIDTPGFCEADRGIEESFTELCKAIIYAKFGVHAIALVINVSQRFTSSQVTFLKEIENFGGLWPFVFVVFSAARKYGPTDSEQREKVLKLYDNPKSPEEFKTLLDRVDKRFIMLESTDKSHAYRNAKITEFLQMVDGIYSKNQKLYSNHLFERAIKLYQEEKKKEKDREKHYQQASQLTTMMNQTVTELNAKLAANQQLMNMVTTLTSELRDEREARRRSEQRFTYHHHRSDSICLVS